MISATVARVGIATVFLLALGCSAAPGGRPAPAPRAASISPLYESPIGGSNVYRVDGEGGGIVTVTPIYESPIGGSSVYRIERGGRSSVVTVPPRR